MSASSVAVSPVPPQPFPASSGSIDPSVCRSSSPTQLWAVAWHSAAITPLHLLNVRARDLSIHAERPRDFLHWAFHQIDQGENDANLLEGLAHAFLPRQLFGEYVRQRLFEAAAVRGDVAFNIINDSAFSLSRRNGRFQVQISGGGSLSADVVILATAYGQEDPSSSGPLAPFEALSRDRVSKAKSIVLIGSGLTMVDALLAVRREGSPAL